jgi:hypothetical protein
MLLTLEDSVVYVKGNFEKLYPSTESRRKTIANLPEGLHGELMKYAETHNLKMFEVIGGLWDFMTQYEDEFSKELKTQRKNDKPRR